jgi:hypothetical protein
MVWCRITFQWVTITVQVKRYSVITILLLNKCPSDSEIRLGLSCLARCRRHGSAGVAVTVNRPVVTVWWLPGAPQAKTKHF